MFLLVGIYITKTPTPSQILKAEINYLDLSKINNNSIIYKALAQANNKTPIELRVSSSFTSRPSSPYQLVGEIINSEQGKQLKQNLESSQQIV